MQTLHSPGLVAKQIWLFYVPLHSGYHAEFGRSTSKDMWQKQHSVKGLSLGLSE